MSINNELYKQFQNSLKTKKLICFGTGIFFWKFISQYDNNIPISMVIDNYKHGEQIKINGVEYTVKNINDIKQYKPEQVIILITVRSDIQDEIKEQLRSMKYFNIFCWSDISQFEEPFFDDVNKYLLTYSAKQIETNYKLKIAHLALHFGGNAGDIVLNYCIRQVFNKMLKDIFFVMYPLHEQVNLQNIDKLNNYDAIIIGGGGLFLPDTNANEISGWQWACSNELMSKIEKPLIGFAIGYNYFNGQQPTELFKNSLNHFAQQAKFIGIRNQRSLQIINELMKIICKWGGRTIILKTTLFISLVLQLLFQNILIFLPKTKIKILQ